MALVFFFYYDKHGVWGGGEKMEILTELSPHMQTASQSLTVRLSSNEVKGKETALLTDALLSCSC